MSDKDFGPLKISPIGAWPRGVDQVSDIKELQAKGAVRGAVNADFRNNGKPKMRRGKTLKFSGICHSLYAPDSWPFGLLVRNGLLTRLELRDGAEVLTSIATINPLRRISYAVQNSDIYLTNGLVTAKVDAAGAPGYWGVPNPGGQPALSASAAGGLDAGAYQVAITFLSAAGEESGCEKAALVTVASGQGIALAHIPQPPAGQSVAAVRIYASPVNGDLLYSVAQIPVGVLSYTLTRGEIGSPGKQLETMLHDRVPPARFVRSFKGRIYFGIGDTLFYTPALRYGVYKRHQAYLRFPHPVVGMMPVSDGFYVATDYVTYWISGDDPKDQRKVEVEGYGLVEHSDTRVLRSAFGLDGGGWCQVWWNTNGNLMRGDASGQVTPMTRGRLALPRYQYGSILHREQDQISQLVSVLKGPSAQSKFAATDRVTMEVYRNGVLLDP